MFDFDDLPSERASSDEDIDGPANVQLHASAKTLPPIPRSLGLPSLEHFEKKRAAIYRRRHPEPDRVAKVRLFCFYGAADSYAAWLPLVAAAPAWAEAAVVEVRAHGVREAESAEATLEERAEDAFEVLHEALVQHSKGGCSDGAPFAFLGHGTGVWLLCLVARRMQQELGLEPAVVFINDGAPPNENMLSDEGYKLLCNDAYRFFQAWDPTVCELHDAHGPSAAPMHETFARWETDMQLVEEHARRSKAAAEVYHKFSCPLHVFVGLGWWELDKKLDSMTTQQIQLFFRKARLAATAEESIAIWEPEAFKRWSRWTAKGECKVHEIMTDHMSIKVHNEVQAVIWNELGHLCGVLSRQT